ncbi:MAG: multidrug transporter [Rhodoglobus sp.]
MSDSMSDEEKRHDQLTRAPKSSEADAAPRITVSETPSGATRIDVADTAAVRPGNPDKQNG